MTDLLTLSRRVSEADGPSRELDAEIANALSWRNGGWSASSYGLPHWTASIDRTAALIAEKLPGYGGSVSIGRMPSEAWLAPPAGTPENSRWNWLGDKDVYAKTPALALLSAALLAIHERKEP